MQYMVIERFKNGDAAAVYRRFHERGRMMPAGLQYVASWIEDGLQRCFQVMETGDADLLDQWMANWQDLMEFEVYPVISSKEAATRVGVDLLLNEERR